MDRIAFSICVGIVTHVQQVVKVFIASMQKCLHDGALYGFSLLLWYPRLLLSLALGRLLGTGMYTPGRVAQEGVLVADQPQHILKVHVCDGVREARDLHISCTNSKS